MTEPENLYRDELTRLWREAQERKEVITVMAIEELVRRSEKMSRVELLLRSVAYALCITTNEPAGNMDAPCANPWCAACKVRELREHWKIGLDEDEAEQ